MSRLVELSDQVIRTKDDCSALESRNRALSEENKKLQASLAADAEKVTARSTQAAAEHREEVERLSRQLADVELRAKNEKADFVKGVEAKDKRIAQLEEQLARLEASKARLEISNKENARHVHVGYVCSLSTMPPWLNVRSTVFRLWVNRISPLQSYKLSTKVGTANSRSTMKFCKTNTTSSATYTFPRRTASRRRGKNGVAIRTVYGLGLRP